MKGHIAQYRMIAYPQNKVTIEKQRKLTELAVGGIEDEKNRSLQYTKEGELVLGYYTPYYQEKNSKQLFFTHIVVYDVTKEILKNYETFMFCQFASGENFIEVVKEPDHFSRYESFIWTREQLEEKNIVTKKLQEQIHKYDKEDTWRELVYEVLYRILIGNHRPIIIFVPESEEDYQRYCQFMLYKLVQYIPYGFRKKLTFETNGKEKTTLIQFVKETSEHKEQYPDAYNLQGTRQKQEKKHRETEELVNLIFQDGIEAFHKIEEEATLQEWNSHLYYSFIKSEILEIEKSEVEEPDGEEVPEIQEEEGRSIPEIREEKEESILEKQQEVEKNKSKSKRGLVLVGIVLFIVGFMSGMLFEKNLSKKENTIEQGRILPEATSFSQFIFFKK